MITKKMKAITTAIMNTQPTASLQQFLNLSPLQVGIF